MTDFRLILNHEFNNGYKGTGAQDQRDRETEIPLQGAGWGNAGPGCVCGGGAFWKRYVRGDTFGIFTLYWLSPKI